MQGSPLLVLQMNGSGSEQSATLNSGSRSDQPCNVLQPCGSICWCTAKNICMIIFKHKKNRFSVTVSLSSLKRKIISAGAAWAILKIHGINNSWKLKFSTNKVHVILLFVFLGLFGRNYCSVIQILRIGGSITKASYTDRWIGNVAAIHPESDTNM